VGEGREWRRKRQGMKGLEMGIHEQIAQKCNIFWHLGTPVGGYRPVSGTEISSQIVCVYLIPFKVPVIVLNLTILQKSPQKFTVFGTITDATGGGGYCLVPYIFRKLFFSPATTSASQIVWFYLQPFRHYFRLKAYIVLTFWTKISIFPE